MKMKNRTSRVILGFLVAMMSLSVHAIDDSIIFENIDSQNSLYGKIQETNNSSKPEFHNPQHTELLVEESALAYASPTKPDATTFEKEKITGNVSKKINAKKAEKMAQEMRALEF